MRKFLIIAFSLAILSESRGAPAMTEEELVRRTQELFDAVVPGKKEPWKKYYADDCIYHDEKDRSLDKAKLVGDVEPLPTGYSGTIKVVNPESRIAGDVAVLSYGCDETETIFGQELHAYYHEIDTWLRRDGEWKIVATQVHRRYEDPAEAKAEPQHLSACIGTYRLGPERKSVITAEGERLFMERTGGKKVELLSEATGIFFRKGVEGRILFPNAASGSVAEMIDRRNNEDVIWKKEQVGASK